MIDDSAGDVHGRRLLCAGPAGDAIHLDDVDGAVGCRQQVNAGVVGSDHARGRERELRPGRRQINRTRFAAE